MRASHDAKNTDIVHLGVWKLKLRLCFIIILQTQRLVDRPFKFCNDHVISLRSPRGIQPCRQRLERGEMTESLTLTVLSSLYLDGRQKLYSFDLKISGLIATVELQIPLQATAMIITVHPIIQRQPTPEKNKKEKGTKQIVD